MAGILALVAVVGGMQFLVPKTPSSSAATGPIVIHRLHPDPPAAAKKAAPAAKKAVAPKRHVTAKHTAAPAPVKKPVVKTPAPAPAPASTPAPAATVPAAAPAAPTATVAAEAPLITPGLPKLLTAALRKDKVVVISTFDPQSQVDAIAYAEAEAGARAAGAGFVGVDVLDDHVVGPFTNLLAQGGLLPDPAVFVMIRPGTMAAQFAGFADRDMVAQAAANALLK